MALRPTRKIIAEFVGVFLIGAVAGGLLTWSYSDSPATDLQFSEPPSTRPRPPDTWFSLFLGRTSNPDSLVDRIDKKYAVDYHLTPEELSRIQPLTSDMAQHTYQIRHEFGLNIMATLDDYHQKIAEQLTPDHRALFEKATAEHRKKLNSLLLLDQSPPAPGPK